MKDLNAIVANNLKRIRQEMKLSLEKVSEFTGVSKAMLRQIETGESSPTINTVWKIATGLKIPYASIINMPQPDTLVVARGDIEPQIEDNGRYRVYSIFRSEEGRRFEIYMLELDENGLFCSNAHGERTQEFITIFEGELIITVGEERFALKTGDSISFKADNPHSYQNLGNEPVRMSMVIYYPL